MSILITFDNVSLSLGHHSLLNAVRLQIASSERVCLIGRNGAGKSSFLKVVEGSLLPDSGSVHRKPNIVIARLQQELPQNCSATVFEFLAAALADTGELLTAYQKLTADLGNGDNDTTLKELARLQHLIEEREGWQLEHRINTIIQRLKLTPQAKVSELSGGWQRRVALGRALVVSPDLLLLDEPTNHLDIEAVQWLEEELLSYKGGLVFITHDRALLQRLATRIIELDRGQLTSWPGDYQNFLRRKQALLAAEDKANAEFDKKLAQEESWIRQGIKARRTRNEGRVRALKALRLERQQRREIQGKVSLNVQEAEKSGALVFEAKNISQKYGNKIIIDNFSIRIMRGDRIGLVGPNGIGKSTLLNILLGKVSPQIGSVTQGTKLNISYFDQLRIKLDPEKTVAENVTDGEGDTVEINGNRRHIIGYLADFLFTPERALTQVKFLSGGEANRLLLARLFSKPSNLLVLDEPTNDLDIETLELLEEILMTYKGTILIVSHDRAFLDNTVTSTLVFQGDGHIEEYIGGYQDWLQRSKATIARVTPFDQKTTASENKERILKTKLTYKEQRELEHLPKQIETLESEQLKLQELTATASFYQQTPAAIAETMAKLSQLSIAIQAAYERWEMLDKKN